MLYFEECGMPFIVRFNAADARGTVRVFVSDEAFMRPHVIADVGSSEEAVDIAQRFVGSPLSIETALRLAASYDTARQSTVGLQRQLPG